MKIAPKFHFGFKFTIAGIKSQISSLREKINN